MSEIDIRIDGRAGRITLNRPKALNSLTWDMCLAIEQALDAWRDADIDLVLIDAAGDRAFCSGGDIAEMYDRGKRGDLDYGRRFWRDEYRMNAKLFEFPKPVVTFLQGFTMGGGVGVGCHGSHRIVCEGSQIAMPEVTIGLLPDVGGTLLLARAPGRLGEFLGTTGYRMDADDAILAEFADYYVPIADWDALKRSLIATGDVAHVDQAASPAPDGKLRDWQHDIDPVFGGETLGDIMRAMASVQDDATRFAQKAIARNAPLAMSVAVEAIHRARLRDDMRAALDQEFRFTYRAVAQGDFIEGIRAAIIDKDRIPKWAHTSWQDVTGADVLQMTMPLGADALVWED